MLYDIARTAWSLADPVTLFAALLLGGGAASAAGLRRLARTLFLVAAAATAVLALTPAERWLMDPLQTRFPAPQTLPATVDGIVVLGGGLDVRRAHGSRLDMLGGSGNRVLAGALLARDRPEARLVYTSGIVWPPQNGVSEAAYAARLFDDLGVAPERIRVEDRSQNTWQNAVYTFEMMQPQAGETWLLVTSAWHLPRAVASFRAAGWPQLVPVPVDRPIAPDGWGDWLSGDLAGALDRLRIATKEYLGLLGYRVLGWTEEIWPAPKSSR